MKAYQDDRFRSKETAGFLDYIDYVRELWGNAGMPGDIKRKGALDNDEDLFPVITYKMKERSPTAEFKEVKPRYRTTVQKQDGSGEYVKVFGQIFDVIVEFEVHSNSSDEADELAMDLDDFLFSYVGYFKERGLQEVTFVKQGEDTYDNGPRVVTHKRPLTYKLRVEKQRIQEMNNIGPLTIDASVHSNIENNNEEES